MRLGIPFLAVMIPSMLGTMALIAYSLEYTRYFLYPCALSEADTVIVCEITENDSKDVSSDSGSSAGTGDGRADRTRSGSRLSL